MPGNSTKAGEPPEKVAVDGVLLNNRKGEAIEFSGLVFKLGIESQGLDEYAAEFCRGVCGGAAGRG